MKRFRLIEEPSSTFDRNAQPAEWESDRVDYIALIKQIVRFGGGPAGVSLEEMEKGIRILKALDGKEIGDILELEDADHTHLSERIRNFRWGVVDVRLVRFAHTVLNATEDVPGEIIEKQAEEVASAAAGRLDGHDQPVR